MSRLPVPQISEVVIINENVEENKKIFLSLIKKAMSKRYAKEKEQKGEMN